eukprot:TRINITY_DN8082_c0_g1_i1.p1 TRINITY_DN8082_c0_g1~~TRINITY_DN8082_c0_g1_i1.p1  ORF type:complete len:450 (-),score=97.50 TRINITY_DN8082_c0_g1_i1:126-1475(-)
MVSFTHERPRRLELNEGQRNLLNTLRSRAAERTRLLALLTGLYAVFLWHCAARVLSLTTFSPLQSACVFALHLLPTMKLTRLVNVGTRLEAIGTLAKKTFAFPADVTIGYIASFVCLFVLLKIQQLDIGLVLLLAILRIVFSAITDGQRLPFARNVGRRIEQIRLMIYDHFAFARFAEEVVLPIFVNFLLLVFLEGPNLIKFHSIPAVRSKAHTKFFLAHLALSVSLAFSRGAFVALQNLTVNRLGEILAGVPAYFYALVQREDDELLAEALLFLASTNCRMSRIFLFQEVPGALESVRPLDVALDLLRERGMIVRAAVAIERRLGRPPPVGRRDAILCRFLSVVFERLLANATTEDLASLHQGNLLKGLTFEAVNIHNDLVLYAKARLGSLLKQGGKYLRIPRSRTTPKDAEMIDLLATLGGLFTELRRRFADVRYVQDILADIQALV